MRISPVIVAVFLRTTLAITCFVQVDTTDRRDAIEVRIMDPTTPNLNNYKCRKLCGLRPSCEGYMLTGSKCVLFGAILPSQTGTCPRPYTLNEKRTTGCPTATDSTTTSTNSTSPSTSTTTAGLGGWKLLAKSPISTPTPSSATSTVMSPTTTSTVAPTTTASNDPCIVQSFPELTLNATGSRPCPVRNPDGTDGPLLVVRAVLDTGKAVTLANMPMGEMDNGMRLLMKEVVRSNPQYVRASSYVCTVVATSSKCPCAPIPRPTESFLNCTSQPTLDTPHPCGANGTLCYVNGNGLALSTGPTHVQYYAVMTDSSYSWIYEDPFHSAFLASTTTISACSNFLLLYVIHITKLGPYSYLLTVFAVCDMLTSCAHAAFQPILHMTSSGFYFFPRYGKIMIAGRSYDTMFALIFIATYYQTFLVSILSLMFYFSPNFERGIRNSCTNNWKRREWILLGVLINSLYILGLVLISSRFTPSEETRRIAPEEIEDIYDIDLRDHGRGFTVLSLRRPDLVTGQTIWHWPSVIGISLLIGMFLGTSVVILYCMWQTNSIIKSSADHLGARTRKIQKDLFKSLLIQTAIPVLFSYIPLATILLFPALTGISLGAFGNVLLAITSVFPSIDAFFVLFFIKTFRIAVIQLFHLPINVNHGSSVDATSGVVSTVTPKKTEQRAANAWVR